MLSLHATPLRKESLGWRLATLLAGSRKALRCAARFSGAEYTRSLVWRSDEAELWLLGWLPGQASSIHDHAGIAIASTVLCGELLEEHYVRSGPSGRVVLAGTSIAPPGAVTASDGHAIHRLRAVGRTPAVSAHLYEPRYTGGTVYTVDVAS